MRLSSLLVVPLLLVGVSCGGSKMKIVNTGLPNSGATLARLRAAGAKNGCLVKQTSEALGWQCSGGTVTFISQNNELVAGCDGDLKENCAGFIAQGLEGGGGGGGGGDGGGTVASGGGPDPSLRPAGSGWQCFVMIKSNLHACERSYTTCDAVRNKLLPKYPDITECAPQAQAYCHSFISDSGNTVLSCWGTQLDCSESTKGAKGSSSCVLWD